MALTSIDLFAGSGGLSLGLELAGFETVFVNELHPLAMNTFVRNRPHSAISRPENQCADVLELTQSPQALEALGVRLRSEHGDIALVSGGPPCQGYSGIGHRRSFSVSKTEVPSNHLYREMATFIGAIAPRAFVFENVRGLLSSRWTSGGSKGEIWEDVQAAFRAVRVKVGRREHHYNIGSELLFAKDYGVPQNRPRVVLVGIRSDIDTDLARSGVGGGYLPAPTCRAPDLVDVLGDLVDPDWRPGGETSRYPAEALHPIQESFRRRHDGTIALAGDEVSEQQYSKHRDAIVEKFSHMLANGGHIPDSMKTKKFAQRVLPARWDEDGPTITVTSLPDDYVHFCQPRVPTVREWARLQTFPDWYQFAGRRTTGGRRRAGDPDLGEWVRDLPRYTQIGNAVPVELGRAIGMHVRELLS